MNKIIEIKKSIDTLYIYWTLTDFCNFKCNYCPSSLHDGLYANGTKSGFPSDSQINKFIDNLIEKHLGNRKLYLIISGGEPTLHPMFATIINRLLPYGFIGVNTNGARHYEWWSKLSNPWKKYLTKDYPNKDSINLNDIKKIINTETQIIQQLQ